MPPVHWVPQPPQLFGSVSVSVHPPEQHALSGEVHCPLLVQATQLPVALHT
jgi:hypothetical protein